MSEASIWTPRKEIDTAGLLKFFPTMALAIIDPDLVHSTSFKLTSDRDNSSWNVVLTTTVTVNTFNIVQSNEDPTISFVLQNTDGVANMVAWGLVGDGLVDNTAAFATIYPLVKLLGLSVWFPAGTFKGQFTFDGDAPVNCAGMRITKFTPSSTSWVVRMFGTGNAALGSTLKNCSITGGGGAGVGLEVGDAGAASSASNMLLERIEVDGFSDNVNFTASVMSTVNDLYSFGATLTAIKFGSERNVTTVTFNTGRFRLSDIGIDARAGHNIVWNNCNVESNRVTGVKMITGNTSGPTSWVFNGGDIEDNGAGADAGEVAAFLDAGVYIDAQAGIGTTKPNNVIFNRTVCSSPAGALDVSVIRGQEALFDHCAFSRLADGGFVAAKFHFNIGTNAVAVRLKQCGEIQLKPTVATYAGFPALHSDPSGFYGYFWEFIENGNNRYTNFETLYISASVTSFNVAGIKTIVADSVGGTININSLANGVDGQVIRIIKPTAANLVNVVHNGTGSDKIFAAAGVTIALTNREGMTLVNTAGVWYQSDR